MVAPEHAECPEIRRASKDCLCETCGLEYWRHPFCFRQTFQGEPWLHVLCNGDHVKL